MRFATIQSVNPLDASITCIISERSHPRDGRSFISCHTSTAFAPPKSLTIGPIQFKSLHIPTSSKPIKASTTKTKATSPLPEVLPILSQLQSSPPLLQDAAATLFAIIGARALVKFFETLKQEDIIDQKLSRKLVHTLAGPLFLLTWPLFSSEPSARFFAAVVPALNALRLFLIGTKLVNSTKTVKAVSRTGDPTELLGGPFYYAIILVAITLLWWRNSATGLLVAAVMCGGDGLADIAGRRWGNGLSLPWNSNKTWAGSVAMLVGGWGLGVGLIMLFSVVMGYFEVVGGGDVWAMAGRVGVISLVATVIESLPINKVVDDNLSVPLVAAVMGSLLLRELPPTLRLFLQ